VTSAPSRKNLVESVLGDFGRIDVLVNNAGGSNGSTAMNTDLSLYEEALQLNFLSLVDLSKQVAARMEKGVILNITSISGRESGGRATYNAAKAAAISFTKSFADEMIRKGIRVVGIAPGSILHPTGNWQKRINENPEKMREFVEREIPAGRFGTVEEVASVAVFLASSKASWVVGATLNVDGGQSRMNF
jgi:3-oxoacyl-[acyl-carrier protein] reductase